MLNPNQNPKPPTPEEKYEKQIKSTEEQAEKEYEEIIYNSIEEQIEEEYFKDLVKREPKKEVWKWQYGIINKMEEETG